MEHNLPRLARLRYRFLGAFLEGIFLELIGIAAGLALVYQLKILDPSLVILIMYVVYLLIAIPLDIFSNVILPRITHGKSFGKALFGIRIVMLDNSKLGTKRLLVRWATLFAAYLVLGWVIFPATWAIMKSTPLKQGLHDRFAKTIVIQSKTSTGKHVLVWIIYLLGIVVSTVAITLFSIGIWHNLLNSINTEVSEKFEGAVETIQRQAKEIDATAVSLSGEDGPLAMVYEDSLGEGEADYMDALDFVERNDYLSAKIEIDEAYRKNPRSKHILAERCSIYSMYEDAFDSDSEAFNICKEAHVLLPNDPDVLGNLIVNAYYVDKCNEVNEFAIKLSNIRIGTNYDDEVRSAIYGYPGIHVLACEVNHELGVQMVQKGIELTNNLQYKKYYQDYLDAYLATL